MSTPLFIRAQETPQQNVLPNAAANLPVGGVTNRPLIFVSNEELPPMVYLKDGQRVGILVDLAEAIKKQIHRPVELKYMGWAEAQQSVLDGRADAVLHINPTEERKTRFDFSHDLLDDDFSIFVKNDRVDLSDKISLRGHRVGVLQKGLCANLLGKDPEVKLTPYTEIPMAFYDLLTGNLDAVVTDRQVGTFLLAENNIAGIRITGAPIDRSTSAIAVKRGNSELLAEINLALAEIRASGIYGDILAKWQPKEVVYKTREQNLKQEHLLTAVSVAVGLAVVIILMFVFWTRSLNRMVAARTLELQQSETKFRQLSDANVIGVAFWNPAGEFTGANDEFLRMVGYTREEVFSRQMRWSDMTPEDFAASDAKVLAEIMSTGATKNYEKEFFHKDGRRVPVLLGAALVEDSVEEGICFVLDLTERKQMETALLEREALLDTLLNAPLEIIMLLDLDGTVLSMNEGGASRFGLKPEAMLGLSIYPFMDDETAQRRKLVGEQVIETGKPVQFFDEREGRYFSSSVYPVFDRAGETVIHFAIFASDITERKRAENREMDYQLRLRALAAEQTLIEEKERKRIAGELHDGIGQTLAFVRTRLSTLRKEQLSSKSIEALNDASEALLEAIRDTKHIVFDLSAPSMNEIGIAAAIEEWLKVRVEGIHGIQTELIDRCGRLPLEDNQRAILFRNVRELLTNVIKHAQAGQVTVSLHSEDGTLQVIVEDDGVGLDMDSSGNEKHKPNSFGLFSIRERMADMGGSLEIVSSRNHGFKAILRVPTHSDGAGIHYD